LVADTPVVEALVMLASVEKSVVTVPTVVDEVLKTDCPVTVSAVADALLSTARPDEVMLVVDALPRVV
jgi:pyrimidine operon attenuation protein/uracil phosphoribosyltransferase